MADEAGTVALAPRDQTQATAEIGCEVAGPAGGQAIVFIHGAIMSRAQWRPQVDRFAGLGYRCIAMDLPGHGELAERPFTLDGAADVVADVVDRLAGGRAVLVGLSLGGYVAMAVAGRSPERVRGLVLAGATREPEGPIRIGYSIVGWAYGLLPEPLLRAISTWLFRRRYGREIAAAILANGYFARGGSRAIRSLGGGRFRERLLAYGGPVLVINGDLDLVFRLGARRFVEGVPGVTRRVLRRAAHLSNLDRPDDFTAAVLAFVQTLEP
jgi:pimeloyl-ACP methyl ester carboxylesterase